MRKFWRHEAEIKKPPQLTAEAQKLQNKTNYGKKS